MWSSKADNNIFLLIYFAVSIELLVGCGPYIPESVPTWAIQIPPPGVDPTAPLEKYETLILAELKGAHHAEQLSPEQLGAMAARELWVGNAWDASVLLALASYRRTEQIHRRVDNDKVLVDYQVDLAGRHWTIDYGPLKALEIRAYGAARFDDEMERISVAVGEAFDTADVREDFERVLLGSLSNPDKQWSTVKLHKDRLRVPPPEHVAHPRLARAVLAYLSLCVERLESSYFRAGARAAARYLALVPLFAYRAAALRKTPNPVDVAVVRSGLILNKRKPELIVSALASDRAPTRSNAALIIGLSEDLTQLPKLENALATEQDSDAALSIRYAMLRLGDQEQLHALESALRQTDPIRVERAIVLASNLPGDLSVQLSEALMRDIAQRSTSTETAVVLAVRTLRNMAAVRPLEAASVQVMLEVAKNLRNSAPALDSVSRDIADLTQLDRVTVFAALQNSSEPAEAWLERFMRIAEPRDLSFLDEVMRRCQIIARHRDVEPQLRRIVRIAGLIKGSQAQALLQDWYMKYPAERRTIALALVLRPDLDKALLEKMFSQTDQDVNRMFYALASAQPDATQQVAAYLSSAEANDKFTATLAVRLFGQPEHTPWLWQNIGYNSAKYYPNDVTLRQLTLSALLHVGLNRRSTVTVQPQAAPAKALPKATVQHDAAPQLPDATILDPAREELPAPGP